MRTKLMILFLLVSFVTNLASQGKPAIEISFGERVIRDYLSYYETQQKTYPTYYPYSHFWFEDSDTRQMVAGFLNTHADSLTNDTIFFIIQKSIVISDNYQSSLNITSGDTLFWLQIQWLDGCRTFVAHKTPFLNVFSEAYWEDLCVWDTVQISKPSKIITCGGAHSFIVRLIYHNGLLASAEFCDHRPKAEYDAEWYHPELDIKQPYPEDKQWR